MRVVEENAKVEFSFLLFFFEYMSASAADGHK